MNRERRLGGLAPNLFVSSRGPSSLKSMGTAPCEANGFVRVQFCNRGRRSLIGRRNHDHQRSGEYLEHGLHISCFSSANMWVPVPGAWPEGARVARVALPNIW